MKWLQSLREPEAIAPQVWHCRPLVVVGPEGRVEFAGEADVDFTPESRKGDTGWVRLHGEHPRSLHVESRIQPPSTGLAQYAPGRPWLVVMGTNADELAETWYIDGAADEFLTRA